MKSILARAALLIAALGAAGCGEASAPTTPVPPVPPVTPRTPGTPSSPAAAYILMAYGGAPLPAVTFAASYDTLWVVDARLTVWGDSATFFERVRNHVVGQAVREDSATSRLTFTVRGDSVRMQYICDMPGAGTCAPGWVGSIQGSLLHLGPARVPPGPLLYTFERTDSAR